MNLIALAFGLFLERFVTHLFHLREPRWLDTYFDRGLQAMSGRHGLVAFVIGMGVVAVPVLPVLLVQLSFRDVLLGLPYLAFAVFVLMFSLGPRDLATEVAEYGDAVDAGDEERAARLAKELREVDPPQDARGRFAIEGAIFVQSNNRLFGVVLWFMLLGPVGAWLFRVTDLLRRRAMFEEGRRADEQPDFMRHARRLHGVMAWPPARLLALGYALAGSFESALSDWRGYYQDCSEHFFEVNDDVVAFAGLGALGAAAPVAESEHPDAVRARQAMKLVTRTLVVWLTVIAMLTIAGWAV